MVVSTLSENLYTNLKQAKEIWIATGMVSDKGFHFLNSLVQPSTIRNFLIGVDLPTSIEVLKEIFSNLVPSLYSAKIGRSDLGIFHPKLYLIKKDAEYIAYVGSANLTDGGLNTNTELSVEITDQEQCFRLLEWFEHHFKNAYPLTAENIALYERFMSSNPAPVWPTKELKLEKNKLNIDIFEGIDFSTRFFRRGDHFAFRQDNWKNKSLEANAERENARKRFLELHEAIYPRFSSFGLEDLYPNQKNHIISMTYHHDNSQKNIDAMWLSYGKSPEEIKEYHTYFPKTKGVTDENDLQSFINHARLQIRIELREIGIWILFGKNNRGSMFDRDYFSKNMKNDDRYKNDFFILMKNLPEEYWIEINGQSKNISEFNDPESLYQFCRKDDPENYFIIGRDYQITDEQMSESRLPETTLVEFKRLLPLYKFMRHRFQSR